MNQSNLEIYPKVKNAFEKTFGKYNFEGKDKEYSLLLIASKETCLKLAIVDNTVGEIIVTFSVSNGETTKVFHAASQEQLLTNTITLRTWLDFLTTLEPEYI